LAHEPSALLEPYFVWVPKLGAHRHDAPAGMSLITDRRAKNYWDARGWLGDAYQRVLGTPGTAWDVYLLYGRGQRWSGVLPPKPTYWMHQLAGVPDAPRLDPDVLRAHVERLLRG
jgi:hypothetical protein